MPFLENRPSLVRALSGLLTFCMIAGSAPMPPQPQRPEPKTPQKMEPSRASNGPRKAVLLRSNPNVESQGEADLEVGPQQKVLILMLTSRDGSDIDGAIPTLQLLGPDSKPISRSELPKMDPASEKQLRAYGDRLIKLAKFTPTMTETAQLSRLRQLSAQNPMPAGLSQKLQLLYSATISTPNLTLPIRDGTSNTLVGAIVLNPSPGRWKMSMRGLHRQGATALLAAGETLSALGSDQKLFESALGDRLESEDDAPMRGPSVAAAETSNAALATVLMCTMCKAAISTIIVLLVTNAGLALTLAMSALGLAAIAAGLLITLVSAYASAKYTPRVIGQTVCKAFAFCK